MSTHLQEQLNHLPIPADKAMAIGILLPDQTDLTFEIDMRPLEMDEYPIQTIGEQWKTEFERAWKKMLFSKNASDEVILFAALPNGATLRCAVVCLGLQSSTQGPAEYLYLETFDSMMRLWGMRNLRTPQESIDKTAK